MDAAKVGGMVRVSSQAGDDAKEQVAGHPVGDTNQTSRDLVQ